MGNWRDPIESDFSVKSKKSYVYKLNSDDKGNRFRSILLFFLAVAGIIMGFYFGVGVGTDSELTAEQNKIRALSDQFEKEVEFRNSILAECENVLNKGRENFSEHKLCLKIKQMGDRIGIGPVRNDGGS